MNSPYKRLRIEVAPRTPIPWDPPHQLSNPAQMLQTQMANLIQAVQGLMNLSHSVPQSVPPSKLKYSFKPPQQTVTVPTPPTPEPPPPKDFKALPNPFEGGLHSESGEVGAIMAKEELRMKDDFYSQYGPQGNTPENRTQFLDQRLVNMAREKDLERQKELEADPRLHWMDDL